MLQLNFRMGFFAGIIPGQIFVCAVMSASGPADSAFSGRQPGIAAPPTYQVMRS